MDTDRNAELRGIEAFEAWLADAPLEAIVDAWWRYTMRWDAAHAAGKEDEGPDWDDDPDGWAGQLVYDGLLMRSEEIARNFLRLAADRAPRESPPGYAPVRYLGAAAIESFVHHTDDLDRFLWVEKTAKESPAFREALRDVYWPTEPWKHIEVDPLVAETIERIQNLP